MSKVFCDQCTPKRMARLSAAVVSVGAVVALSSCASTPSAQTATLQGEPGDGKISVRFEDFQDGTRCTVLTPKGSLTIDQIPGTIEYPALYRASPITCRIPTGPAYAIDVESSLPADFRVAGFTAYLDGRLFGTLTTGDDVLQVQKSDGVRRLN